MHFILSGIELITNMHTYQIDIFYNCVNRDISQIVTDNRSRVPVVEP